MEIITNKKVVGNYHCITCYYHTSKKFNYDKHILTAKHKLSVIGNQKVAIVDQKVAIVDQKVAIVDQKVAKVAKVAKFTCNKCEIHYTTNSGLWKHNQKCKIEPPINSDSELEPISDANLKTDLLKKDNLIEYLIKENQEFKTLIMELIKKDSANITNNVNSHNVNNTAFNLNLFLNEKCKDAINITDFVDNVKMNLSDLENFGDLGYVEGVTRILIKNLKDLDTYLRPIHCSDLKREVLYIKDNDKWTKEQEDKPLLKNAIKQVANKNIKQIQVWKNEHPDCTQSESRKNDQYINIVMNSMSGGTNEEQQTNISQIVKNVSKVVAIDKMIEK
jgi:hypothetical protein